MKRSGALCLVVFFLTTLGACKRHDLGNHHGYILGPGNDILPLGPEESAKAGSDLTSASVLVTTRLASDELKFCSGTVIDNKGGSKTLRVLTNHHCFAKTGEDGKAISELIEEACSDTKVHFGFAPRISEEVVTRNCKEGSLRTDFRGDLAVFSVEGELPSTPPAVSLWSQPAVPEQRSAVIIHYPDIDHNRAPLPGGKTPLPTAATTYKDCKVVGLFPKKEWHLDRALEVSMRHTCDLATGSSGSALIDRKTGALLGVNWGGIQIEYDDKTRTDNAATHVDYVRDFLAGREPSLSREAEKTSARNDGSGGPSGRPGSGDANPKGPSSDGKKAGGKADGDDSPSWSDISCGVVGHTTTSAALSWLMMALGLAFPLLRLFSSRARS